MVRRTRRRRELLTAASLVKINHLFFYAPFIAARAVAMASSSKQHTRVEFSSALTARQRARVHALAEDAGAFHASRGVGDDRHIVVGDDVANASIIRVDAVCDVDICRALALVGISCDVQAFRAAGKGEPRGDAGRDAWTAKTTQLLELERAAEEAQAMEILRGMTPEVAARRGRAMLGLTCVDARGGLLGQTVLTLELASRTSGGDVRPLPAHKLSPHDVVCLRQNKSTSDGEALASGVVYRIRDTQIEVACDDAPDDLSGTLRLERLANDATHKRLVFAVERVGKCGHGGECPAPGSHLVDIAFGDSSPRVAKKAAKDVQWLNPSLDASQRAAIEHALQCVDFALIHGPPGTGKTTAVVEYIAQEVTRGSRVLACTASNVAIDNLVERLMKVKLSNGGDMRLVRVGHPARLLPSVLQASLEAQILASDNSKLAKDCAKESKALRKKLDKLTDRKDRNERNDVRKELRVLAKEERNRQKTAMKDVVSGARVVCATLSGALSGTLKFEDFDVVVVDEAAQALEASCWGAVLKGKKAVLAGDHLQLPPTVISDEAQEKGLSDTLFQRLHDLYGDGVARMLTVQYRMHTDIMQWSSDAMYQGKLTAAESVATHRLCGDGDDDPPVLLLIDTAGCDMEERVEEDGESKENPGEARVVMAVVKRLMNDHGVCVEDIGVITPYNGQVAILRELRAQHESMSALEVSTVDGFQGREKEAIIISAVRSNPNSEVGFLSDSRRMNVAVTRARKHCCLICDTDTARGDAFLAHLVEYFEAHGHISCAAEFVE